MIAEQTELTPTQQKLTDLLWETQTEAPVNRRRTLPDGGFEFYKVVRPTRPIDFPVNDEEFALKLHERKPEAPLSPIYINLRSLPENVLFRVALAITEIPLETDELHYFCTGIPTAGEPIAEKYSEISGITLIGLFDKASLGSGRRVLPSRNARIGRGEKLMLIDDLITEADTKFEAIEVAENLGYKVSSIAVLFDREQGGVRQLEQAGYKVLAALKLTPTLMYYLQTGKIDQRRYDAIIEYLDSSR